MIGRKDVRYQIECPVAFVVDGNPGRGSTFNLSRGGCAIETDLFVTVGDPVSLTITVAAQPTPVRVDLPPACVSDIVRA